MKVRRRLLLLGLLLTAVGGCQKWMPQRSDGFLGQPREDYQLEIPELEVPTPKFRRPRASVKPYSLTPRGRDIERSLGYH